MTEQCQTYLMERNLSLHRLKDLDKRYGPNIGSPLIWKTFPNNNNSNNSSPNGSSVSMTHYSSTSSIPDGKHLEPEVDIKTIRFQIVIWYVGEIDVVQGRVPITFRVTLFWNADDPQEEADDVDDHMDSSRASSSNNLNGWPSVRPCSPITRGRASSISSRRCASPVVWQMHGRQKAVEKELLSQDEHLQTIDVPPVSILNVAGSFDTIGSPEVCMLRESDRLMRWTCMYRATLMQDHWRMDSFPHDEHKIAIKLAILAHRNKPGAAWDKRRWKLALATVDDSQGSTSIPYGLIVEVVSIPGFSFAQDNDNAGGLDFSFVPLKLGASGVISDPYGSGQDECLKVQFKVLRDSSYYDKNIMPLLAVLNVVAVSITAGMEPQDFFQKGLMTLNICFVQIGMRMSLDAKLPSVSYQIKMQRILNEYFLFLLFLVLEGMLVYVLNGRGFSSTITYLMDLFVALLALSHNICTCVGYYRAAAQSKAKIRQGESVTADKNV